MKVSAKAEYACLAMLALAGQQVDAPPMHIRDIAERQGIPERYLVQILLQLKGAGLVTSQRGASGGYRLAKPASRIAVSEVLRAIDGPEEQPREPRAPEARALASLWAQAHDAQWKVLDETSIAEVASRAAPPDWVI